MLSPPYRPVSARAALDRALGVPDVRIIELLHEPIPGSGTIRRMHAGRVRRNDRRETVQEIANVAHSLSAKKRVRQSIKRRARNRARKEVVKDQVKAFTVALASGDLKKAESELNKTASRLDRVASKGTIHKKTAARKRSRLAKRLNAVRSGALKVAAPAGKAKGKPKAAKKGAGTSGATA
jgi:small subunit ribosomal protein S20